MVSILIKIKPSRFSSGISNKDFSQKPDWGVENPHITLERSRDAYLEKLLAVLPNNLELGFLFLS